VGVATVIKETREAVAVIGVAAVLEELTSEAVVGVGVARTVIKETSEAVAVVGVSAVFEDLTSEAVA